MIDKLSKEQRSTHMAKIRGRGNLSTEGKVEETLLREGIRGWEKHPISIRGRPDFFFPKQNLALFVDGCFWHGCSKCNRRTPQTRRNYWREKIIENRRRDARQRQALRRMGYSVMRIWEHDLENKYWIKRLVTHRLKLESNKSLSSS